jgi:hypothetical protein
MSEIAWSMSFGTADATGAKRHRIEPWTYLRELLLRLHDNDPRLDEMLPGRWTVQHAEAVLADRLTESRRKPPFGAVADVMHEL